MATVVQETEHVAIDMSFMTKTYQFFAHNWKWMILSIIILIIGIVVFYIFKKWEDERKERDEPGYQLYKGVKSSCRLQADKSKIHKTWNPTSLILLIFPPLWWFIPMWRKERSAKVLDAADNLLGYYRGQYISMDNTLNLLVYKKKILFFFEELFVIKIPRLIRFKEPVLDRDGKVLYVDVGGKKIPKLKDRTISFLNMVKPTPGKSGHIKVFCYGLERVGMYYFTPVFMSREGSFIDIRQFVEGAVIDSTNQLMLQRVLNLSAQQMEKGMLLNPYLQYTIKSPEKTKEEEKFEGG